MDTKNIPIGDQNLLDILGAGDLPEDQKAALVDKAAELVQKRLLVRLFDSLSEDKQKELAGIVEGEAGDKFQAFVDANAPDFADWAGEEAIKVKEELVQLKQKQEG